MASRCEEMSANDFQSISLTSEFFLAMINVTLFDWIGPFPSFMATLLFLNEC